MKSKNLKWNILFFVSLFIVTIYLIFRGENLSLLVSNIYNADWHWWIYAVLCVILYIFGEAYVTHFLLKSVNEKTSILDCFLYSCIDYFFSCITPSASGGQPAELYFMKKRGLSVPVSTMILIIITTVCKLVLVVLGLSVLIIRPSDIISALNPVMFYIYLGIVLNIICIAVMIMLLYRSDIVKKIGYKSIKLLCIISKKFNYNKLIKRLDNYIVKYKDCSEYFANHTGIIFKTFIVTVIQRFILFFVTYLVYRSFGLNNYKALIIVVLQGMVAVAVDMLPLPGGMGISEKLFLEIFSGIFGCLTLPGMIVSRGIAYYVQLVFSAVMTGIAYFVIKNPKGKEE